MRTIVDLLKWRGEHQPERLAYRFLADGEDDISNLTYAELDQDARNIAAGLQQVSRAGDRVLLLFPSGIDYIRAFAGCLYAGCVSVTAYPPKAKRSANDSSWQRLQAIAVDAEARVVLTTAALRERMQSIQSDMPELRQLEWIAVDTLREQTAEDWRPPAGRSDSLAFLQYTSGSTSTPKGVMVSQSNLMHNLGAVQRGLHTHSESVLVGWLPLFHDMGLIGMMLHAVYVGAPYFFFAPAVFIQKPARWLNAISRFRGTCSGAPNFAFDLCADKIKPEEREGLDLSCWYAAFNGAEPVRAGTLERFTEAFRPCGFDPKAFTPCYGLAEATLVVSIGFERSIPVTGNFDAAALEQRQVVAAAEETAKTRRLVACGEVIAEQQTVIVDPETRQICPPGHIGEIWVHGPSIAQGYWRRPEETQQIFGAYLADDATGPFLRTGDLGFLQDNKLTINGRLKDTLIIRGANHYPQDIELTVEGCHPALRPAGAAAFAVEEDGEERLVLVQELQRTALRADMKPIYAAIRRAVAEEHGVQVHCILLVGPGGVSKTTSGKVQRSACRAAWLEGTLETVGVWRQGDSTEIPAETAEPLAASRNGNHGPKTKPETLVAETGETAPLAKNGKSTSNGHTAAGNGHKTASNGQNGEKNPTIREIELWLIRRLGRHLHVAAQEILPDQAFAQYGLDSAASVGMTGELQDWLGRKIAPTVFYEYPTIRLLAHYLSGESAPTPALLPTGMQEPIAVVGMGCRFPGGANDPAAYWQLLAEGVDAVTRVPAERWDAEAWYDADPSRPNRATTRWGAFLDRVDGFDAAFFGISPREARQMDPQQRLMLEVAWEALEDAGLTVDGLRQSAAGVYVGAYNSDYFWMQLAEPETVDPYTSSGNAHSMLANRLSYFLDLRGPSLTVDTACSSSLVAVHLACQGLRNGDCQVAFAGAVNLILSPLSTVVTGKTLTMAADGRCKAFDASADGIVRGEGAGVVVLKRLADAVADGDRVLAVIYGSAVNQDGRTNGITAPNGLSQQAVIRQALAASGIAASQVGYIEAHGTGTPLGDPIEIGALEETYGKAHGDAGPCFVGSVKTNLGHLEAAAGMAGLLKVVLSLRHGAIPPHLHFHRWNPHITVKDSPFVIPRYCTPWPTSDAPRCAGLSSFGFGGTNVHMLVGEPALPPMPDDAQFTTEDTGEHGGKTLPTQRGDALCVGNVAGEHGGKTPNAAPFLLPISAGDAQALRTRAADMSRLLLVSGEDGLRDLCATAGVRRSHLRCRAAFVGESGEALAAQLAAFAEREVVAAPIGGLTGHLEKPRLAFVFSGQGPQWATMGSELMRQEPTFRETLEECDELYREITGRSLLAEMEAPEEQSRLSRTEIAQPALFALQVALASLLRSWGVAPDAVVGHSMGEVAAAHSAGVLSLPDAMRLIVARGRLMERAAGQGKMAAVSLSADAAAPFLSKYEGVTIAAVNSPDAVTISGAASAVEAVARELRDRRIACRLLPGSYAFHSEQMEFLRAELTHALQELQPAPETIPFVSTVSGGLLSGAQLNADYWFRNSREAVRFAPAVQSLIADGVRLFVEIGPQPALSPYLAQCLDQAQEKGVALPCLRRGKERHTLLTALAELYTQGFALRWDRLHPAAGRLVSLPPYPFQRETYWLPTSASHAAPSRQTVPRTDEPTAPQAAERPKPSVFRLPDAPEEQLPFLETYVRERVQRILGLNASQVVDRDRSLSTVGLDSLMVVELKNQVEREMNVLVPTTFLVEGPSIAQVALRLHAQLGGKPASVAHPPLAAPETPQITEITDVADLSDADVDRLLQMMMQERGE